MKKYYLGAISALIAVLVVVSATLWFKSCNDKDKIVASVTNVEKVELGTDFTVPVETIVSMDKEYVYLIADTLMNEDGNTVDVNYFETQVKFTGKVDTLSTPSIESIVNVFQINVSKDGGYKTTVYEFYHDASESFVKVHPGAFVFGDNNMYQFNLTVTLNDAFDILQKVNCKKPSSAYVTLRFPVEYQSEHPKWIFGNDKLGVVKVDAIDGTVTHG